MNIFHLGIRNMFPIRCLPACQFQLYFHLFFSPGLLAPPSSRHKKFNMRSQDVFPARVSFISFCGMLKNY